MKTVFFRLLADNDKAGALAAAVGEVNAGQTADNVYFVDPDSFRQVPNTPFCYWVSERIRRLFEELPPFEGEGRTVRQGLATADDFRFVRAWWEVPAERILDSGQYAVGRRRKAEKEEKEKWTEERIREFQAWCRRRTCEGKRWVPFAKGGEYSPYYADIHLVVNWERDGAEIRNFVDPKTGKTYSRPQNTDYYFRPGLTWSVRTRRFNPWPLPAGCVFSHRSYTAFILSDELQTYVLFNSKAWDFLFRMMLGRFGHPEYLVGVAQKLPWPLKLPAGGGTAMRALETAMKSFSKEECSLLFIQALLSGIRNVFLRDDVYEEFDRLGYEAYGFRDVDRAVVEATYKERFGEEERDEGQTVEYDHVEEHSDTAKKLWANNLLSYVIGCTYGRWDVRIARDPSLAPKLPDPFDPLPVCPPGMLVGPDGLPAKSGRIVSEEWLRARPDANTLPPDGTVSKPTIPDSEYPLRINWDGILVDDPGFNGARPHRDDIVRRVREVLDLLWGDRAQEIEQEACEILGVRELRDYFRKPSGFFQDHLKRYSKSRRKAPIYWPLSTASGSYTIWLYYHRLTDQTLYAAVNKYLEPKIADTERVLDRLEEELAAASGREATRLRDRLNEGRTFLGELQDLREELLRVAGLPYKPDLNDGVIINAAPLHRLFRLRSWAKETEKVWKKLEKGDYDWAHMAYTIWPDRVREVCRRDRSIAIAHGLEDICEVEPPAPKKKSGRGRRRKEAAR